MCCLRKVKAKNRQGKGRGEAAAAPRHDRSERDLLPVAEAKVLELLALRRFGRTAGLLATGAIKPGEVLAELALPAVVCSDRPWTSILVNCQKSISQTDYPVAPIEEIERLRFVR
jgi:hypothetical protein